MKITSEEFNTLTDIQKEAIGLGYLSRNKYGLVLSEDSSCCDPMTSNLKDIDGICPDCGTPTVYDEAAYGCSRSPVYCKSCWYRACDGSC